MIAFPESSVASEYFVSLHSQPNRVKINRHIYLELNSLKLDWEQSQLPNLLSLLSLGFIPNTMHQTD